MKLKKEWGKRNNEKEKNLTLQWGIRLIMFSHIYKIERVFHTIDLKATSEDHLVRHVCAKTKLLKEEFYIINHGIFENIL